LLLTHPTPQTLTSKASHSPNPVSQTLHNSLTFVTVRRLGGESEGTKSRSLDFNAENSKSTADETMKKASALFLTLLALALAIWGIQQLLPERNVFGNPQLETLVTQCQVPARKATVRLYQGDGGATVASWYSVTFSTGKFSRERQFFYTYAWPTITSIDCRAGEVAIITNEKTFNLSLDQVHNELVHQPMGFYQGQQQKSFIQPLRVLTIIWGLFLVLVSTGIGRRSIKLFRTP